MAFAVYVLAQSRLHQLASIWNIRGITKANWLTLSWQLCNLMYRLLPSRCPSEFRMVAHRLDGLSGIGRSTFAA